MEIEEYAKATRGTVKYPEADAITYLTLGLCGEAGEVAELVKKAIRSGKVLDRNKVKDELGDVFWYATRLADELSLGVSAVLEANVEKLKERQVRGTISER